jgi:hypothetical protein
MCLNYNMGAISQLFLLLRTNLGILTLQRLTPASCCSQFSLKTRSVPLLDRAHTFRRPIRVTTRRKAKHSALCISQFAHGRLQLSRTIMQCAQLNPMFDFAGVLDLSSSIFVKKALEAVVPSSWKSTRHIDVVVSLLFEKSFSDQATWTIKLHGRHLLVCPSSGKTNSKPPEHEPQLQCPPPPRSDGGGEAVGGSVCV